MTHSLFRRVRDLLFCVAAAAVQVVVFVGTPLLNQIYDGWPRGWLILSVAILAALVRGVRPGLTALATGVALIVWEETTFTPMHPAIEVFAAIGVTQILVIHRLQVAQRLLLQRQDALENERNRANYLQELAERASGAKDQFLAALSHEMRTPLTVILGYSRMLRSRMASPEFVRNTSVIMERNALAQLRIVEDLLDVQRFLQGRIAIEYELFDTRALVAHVGESLQPLAAEKKLELMFRVEPVIIEADRARVQQVLWNLLSNAIKFTPEQGWIRLSALREADSLVLTVEDSGDGIPPHFLPHLFEPFRQLDMSTTRRHGGLGLGLAIVRNIVEAHGGTIAAENAATGARFVVRMPLRRAGARPAGAMVA